MDKKIFVCCVLVLAVLAVAGLSPMTASAGADVDDKLERGKYLAILMDCVGCHTDGYLVGKADAARYLAGSSIGFGSPAGVVYPSNLTSHEEHGLGRWSDEDIIRAIRAGVRPDGRPLAPIMPWPNYAHLKDKDVEALVAYLRSLEPNDFDPPDPVKAGEKAPGPYLDLVVPKEDGQP